MVERSQSFEISTDNSLLTFPKIDYQDQDKLIAIGLSAGDSDEVINCAKELGVSCSESGFFAFGVDWILC